MFSICAVSLSQWSRGEGLRDPGGQPIEVSTVTEVQYCRDKEKPLSMYIHW